MRFTIDICHWTQQGKRSLFWTYSSWREWGYRNVYPHLPTAEWKSFEKNSSILDLASYAIGWRHFPAIKSFGTLKSFKCTVRRRPLASKSKTQKFKASRVLKIYYSLNRLLWYNDNTKKDFSTPPPFKVNYCISICNTESCIRNRWLM